MTEPILAVRGVTKTYAGGTVALRPVDLDIAAGEIFALLGPNGAGKTTLISIICGIVSPTAGTIAVDGHDALRDFRAARRRIGLVPQELSVDMFETVAATVGYSRRLFGHPADPAHVERVLRDLALWDKRDAKVMELSGGMKRRVLIAKALAHEPRILFLDEPTAGVDVSLRRDMWRLVHRLREQGTTIILTTHYIEEAEAMADRIGVIDRGALLLVEGKASLMRRLGRRTVDVTLDAPLRAVPATLDGWTATLAEDGASLHVAIGGGTPSHDIPALVAALDRAGVGWRDLETGRTRLEDIFVSLVGDRA